MKRIVIASIIALVGIGTASADYQGESSNYQVNNIDSTIDLSTLPATAAGKSTSGNESSLPVGFVVGDPSRPKL